MTLIVRNLFSLLIAAAVIGSPITSRAEYRIDYSAEAVLTAGSGDFAPYYVASNNHGIVTQRDNALLRASVSRPVEMSKRFSYGFAADLIGGYGSNVDYLRYSDGALRENPQHPSRFWIQQLYGEIKYRGVFLTAGLKQHQSAILYNPLTSGDLIESGNSRPVPEVRAGFIDFQNIPFTKGWLQIQGEISYGKPTDSQWLKNHYNYYNYHINLGALYTYKRCYFRTKPSQPFSATFGMQVGAQFGGTSTWFTNGVEGKKATFSRGIKQFFKMFLPTDGGVEYYAGSSLGSWDVAFRYRLRNEYTIRDYLDFTNQSGPLHWDPDDNPGTTITNRAEGADNYYNNHEYNSYAYYGMAIGTPFLPSPIYNRDGALLFLHNRVRGFHIGVEGNIVPTVAYRLLGGYRKSFGTPFFPTLKPMTDTSFMAEATWQTPLKGLTLKGQFALDHGTLFGNNTGGCVTVAYRGAFSL